MAELITLHNDLFFENGHDLRYSKHSTSGDCWVSGVVVLGHHRRAGCSRKRVDGPARRLSFRGKQEEAVQRCCETGAIRRQQKQLLSMQGLAEATEPWPTMQARSGATT